MDNIYCLLMGLVVLFPIILSFEKKVYYFGKWHLALLSALIIAIPYLIWDAFEAAYGIWGFNSVFAGDFRLFYLPVGEYLFFFCVPFSCLFIYEVVTYFKKKDDIKIPQVIFILASLICAILAIIWNDKAYTLKAFGTLAFFFLILAFSRLRNSKRYYLYILISYVPFLIINGILTGLPVVTYNINENLGIRVGPIPLEDFFYNLAFLGFIGMLYQAVLKRKTLLKT